MSCLNPQTEQNLLFIFHFHSFYISLSFVICVQTDVDRTLHFTIQLDMFGYTVMEYNTIYIRSKTVQIRSSALAWELFHISNHAAGRNNSILDCLILLKHVIRIKGLQKFDMILRKSLQKHCCLVVYVFWMVWMNCFIIQCVTAKILADLWHLTLNGYNNNMHLSSLLCKRHAGNDIALWQYLFTHIL